MESEDNGERQQRKIYFVNEQLKELHSKLTFDVQLRIPLENLTLLGNLCKLFRIRSFRFRIKLCRRETGEISVS